MTDLKIIMRIARTDLAILFYSPICMVHIDCFLIPDNSKFYVINGEYSDRL